MARYIALVPTTLCNFLYHVALFSTKDLDWRLFSLKITSDPGEVDQSPSQQNP